MRGGKVVVTSGNPCLCGDCGGGPPPTTGACCIAGVCSIKTAAECATLGGNFAGVGTNCTTTPCVCPDPVIHADISIKFSGISVCPPFIDVSINGTFSATWDGFEWVGIGGKFKPSEFEDETDAFFFVNCVSGIFNVVYAADNIFTQQFFNGTGPLPSTSNAFVNCVSGGIGELGTSVISL